MVLISYPDRRAGGGGGGGGGVGGALVLRRRGSDGSNTSTTIDSVVPCSVLLVTCECHKKRDCDLAPPSLHTLSYSCVGTLFVWQLAVDLMNGHTTTCGSQVQWYTARKSSSQPLVLNLPTGQVNDCKVA